MRSGGAVALPGSTNGCWLLTFRGRVQGVGFRPFVFRQATRLGLQGWVTNQADGATISVCGRPDAAEELVRLLRDEGPPTCLISEVVWHRPPDDHPHARGFTIVPSSATGFGSPQVLTDLAVCSQCLAELRNNLDRRSQYPFITCCDCGPRYTIQTALPFDRERTTMADFPPCAGCAEEYISPGNRRFHAETISCPDCGPVLSLVEPGGAVSGTGALDRAVEVLRRGGILAVKGIGGYQLMADATSGPACGRIRSLKGRGSKPLALLVRDAAMASRYCVITAPEADELQSQLRPIVLLDATIDAPVDPSVAPHVRRLGLMIAPSPLHWLLVNGVGRALVATSANPSGSPMVIEDEAALRTFGPDVDGVLMHNRRIARRLEDPVCEVAAGGFTIAHRLGRGNAPVRFAGGTRGTPMILGAGSDLKNSVCVYDGRTFTLSGHNGDLLSGPGRQEFLRVVDQMVTEHGIAPGVIAHDVHPATFARSLSQRYPDAQLQPIQHHHAHMVSAMVENDLDEPVLAVVLDGMGWGTDGSLWGGEVLIGDRKSFVRGGHLSEIPLPGGDAAVRRPARIAAALIASGSERLQPPGNEQGAFGLSADEARIVRRMVERRINTPRTSSVGRLIDAVSAALGICQEVTYEGQAAIELEAAAEAASPIDTFPVSVRGRGGEWILDAQGLFLSVVESTFQGRASQGQIAASFQASLVEGLTQLAQRVGADSGLTTTVLSGGVFANRFIRENLTASLQDRGFRVVTNLVTPAGDGGIALGQAAIALGRAHD